MKFDFPTFLTHYYEGTEQPFLSLSDLDDMAMEQEFIELTRLPLGVHRFKTLEESRRYMRLRRDAEAKVRLRFIDKGGKPISRIHAIWFSVLKSGLRIGMWRKKRSASRWGVSVLRRVMRNVGLLN